MQGWGRRIGAAMAAAVLAACGGDATAPPPAPELVLVADSGAFQAAAPGAAFPEPIVVEVRDSLGRLAGGVAVTFAPAGGVQGPAPQVVTTGLDGRARVRWQAAPVPGASDLEVTAGDRAAPLRIPARAIRVTAVSPATLAVGQEGTLSGEGFDVTRSSVTIGGAAAQVLAATATSLRFLIPADACVPGGTVTVAAGIGGASSAGTPAPVSGAAPLALAVGEQRVLRGQGTYCVVLPDAASDAEWLVGVQSLAGVPELSTPVLLRGAGAAAPRVAALAVPTALRDGLVDLVGALDRHARHRAAEAALRAAEARVLAPLRGVARAPVPAARTAAALPLVGDTLPVRVINVGNPGCAASNFATIRAVVRAVGQRGIWLEDTGNPTTDPFTPADWQALSDAFDQHIYATDVAYFGEPSDLDADARVRIVVTKEINRASASLLGFVWSGDLFPVAGPGSCGSSNVGEYYYAKAPDPGNLAGGGAYSRAQALADGPNLIAHEFTHVIQFSRRLLVLSPARPSMQRWEAEGQATLAEMLVGLSNDGLAFRQNHDSTIALPRRPAGAPPGTEWYADPFADHAVYFGFNGRVGGSGSDPRPRLEEAPHACSFLSPDDPGICLSGRVAYGVPAILMFWMLDHLGPLYPGGERQMQRDFTDASVNTGFAALAQLAGRVGADFRDVQAQWGASLFTDDLPGMAPRLTLPSWNLPSIWARFVVTGRPTPIEWPGGSVSRVVAVRGGSSAYVRFAGPRPATAFTVGSATAAPLGDFQVWVVRVR